MSIARSKKINPIAVVLLLVAALLGGSWLAGVEPSAEAKAKKGKTSKARKAEPTADCKKDSDCVAVADDCCPCSQGGKQRSIPKKERDSYEKDRRKRCAGTACTEMVSTDPSCSESPICAAGICELGGGGPAPTPEM